MNKYIIFGLLIISGALMMIFPHEAIMLSVGIIIGLALGTTIVSSIMDKVQEKGEKRTLEAFKIANSSIRTTKSMTEPKKKGNEHAHVPQIDII